MQKRYSPQDVRKTITAVLKNTSQIKIKSFDEVKQVIIHNLKEFPGDIRDIISDNDETLAHMTVKEDKYDSFRLIVESYITIIGGLNEKFFNWFLQENSSNETVLELCAQKGNQQIIKYIHSIIIKTSETKFRITEQRSGIFHHAAQNNQCYPIIFFYEKLQNFYKENLIIDVPNENGITPLHYACIKGAKQTMDLLLDLGVNLNAVDSDNNTCLHYAVMSRNKRVVKKLLIRGADRTKRNKDGKTPYDQALENHDNEIAELLLNKRQCCNLCSSDDNVEAITGNRNSSLLLFTVVFAILFKFIYTYRINYVYLGEFKPDILPFVPLINSKNYQEYTSYTDLFTKENGTCFFSKNCYIEITITIITMFLDYIVLGIIIYFMCCGMNNYVKKKSKNKASSLIELYEKSKYVCVKCRTVTDASTIHCIICNSCVKEFDHHCFWLNTCISKRNKNTFNLFIYTMLLFLIGNCLFFVINVLMVYKWNENGSFEKVVFGYDTNGTSNEYLKIGWQVVNGIIAVIIVYFMFSIILPMVFVDWTCCCCNKKKRRSQFESRMLRGSQQLLENSLEQIR